MYSEDVQLETSSGLFAIFKDCQHLREKGRKLPRCPKFMFIDFQCQKLQNLIQDSCEQYLGAKLDEDQLDGVFFVRNVAPSKKLMRASFSVPVEVWFDLGVPESDKENCDKRSEVIRASSPDACESLRQR